MTRTPLHWALAPSPSSGCSCRRDQCWPRWTESASFPWGPWYSVEHKAFWFHQSSRIHFCWRLLSGTVYPRTWHQRKEIKSAFPYWDPTHISYSRCWVRLLRLARVWVRASTQMSLSSLVSATKSSSLVLHSGLKMMEKAVSELNPSSLETGKIRICRYNLSNIVPTCSKRPDCFELCWKYLSGIHPEPRRYLANCSSSLLEKNKLRIVKTVRICNYEAFSRKIKHACCYLRFIFNALKAVDFAKSVADCINVSICSSGGGGESIKYQI